MKVHYTGKLPDLDSSSRKKLDVRFSRLSKFLDRKSEKEAHVILTAVRHLHKAEITVNFYDQSLAGLHAAPDTLAALTGALDKLEKQLVRLHDKRIAAKRRAGRSLSRAAAGAEATPASDEPRIFRVNHDSVRKPMTVEEALLEIDTRPYVVYRDAETERLAVLLRRSDGHFDLIEG